MKLKNLSKEELESMSYDDIAYIILEEKNEKIKITDLFKQICDLLDLSDAEYESRIADFFQVLSTDQRFTMLEKGYWDLKKRYQSKLVIADEDEDQEEELSEEETEEDEETESEEEDNIFYDEDQDDDTDDDYKDLVIVDENTDEENANM